MIGLGIAARASPRPSGRQPVESHPLWLHRGDAPLEFGDVVGQAPVVGLRDSLIQVGEADAVLEGRVVVLRAERMWHQGGVVQERPELVAPPRVIAPACGRCWRGRSARDHQGQAGSQKVGQHGAERIDRPEHDEMQLSRDARLTSREQIDPRNGRGPTGPIPEMSVVASKMRSDSSFKRRRWT